MDNIILNCKKCGVIMKYKKPINQICEHCENYHQYEGGGGFYYICEHLNPSKKDSGTRNIEFFQVLSEKLSLKNWQGKQVSLGLEEE